MSKTKEDMQEDLGAVLINIWYVEPKSQYQLIPFKSVSHNPKRTKRVSRIKHIFNLDDERL